MTAPDAHKRAVVIRSLLERFHPEDSGELIAHLPTAEQTAVSEAEAGPTDGVSLMVSPQVAMEAVHHSWINELSNKLGTAGAALCSSALNPSSSLSEPVRAFILGDVWRRLGTDPVVPVACLPDTPLKALLDISKRKLVQVIALAGLRDLAAAIKQTVNRTEIQEVEVLLSQRQRRYVHKCLHETDPLPGPKLDLSAWAADLLGLVQQSGLIRLGRAAAHESSSLLWHLAHHLDVGRGRWVLKHAKESVAPKVSERLTTQIVDAVEFLGGQS